MSNRKYNRIKSALADKDRKANWLADKLGKHITTISGWSRNKYQPDLPTLFEVAKLLEVSPCELLGDGEEEK